MLGSVSGVQPDEESRVFDLLTDDHARDLAEGDSRNPGAEIDLSGEVTVFVTTVGAPSFDACMEQVARQDCRVPVEVIRDIAPMSAAFRKMLDVCETPYYVQVDEDMLLYSHAVRTLYDAIKQSGNSCAIVDASLFDLHLQRFIRGVKIVRHDTARQYPYQDVISCDRLQRRQLEAEGHVVGRLPKTKELALGLHGVFWTLRSAYERYSTLERRRRQEPEVFAWFDRYPEIFLRRFRGKGSKLDLYALMGVIAGAFDGGASGEKDFRNYDTLPGIQAIRRFVEETQPH